MWAPPSHLEGVDPPTPRNKCETEAKHVTNKWGGVLPANGGPFFKLFEPFPQKSKRGPMSGPKAVQIHRMDPKGPKRSPRINKLTPRSNQVRKTSKVSYQGWQGGAPSVTIEAEGLPKCQKNTKRCPRVLNKA